MASSTDLLEQEEAFHRLNAELELKTRKLMKDVEAVVARQSQPRLWTDQQLYHSVDEMYENSTVSSRSRAKSAGYRSPQSDSSDLCPKVRLSRRPMARQGMSTPSTLKSFASTDDLLPASTKGMSAESQVRFLKAKCKVLQEEMATAKREISIRAQEWRQSQQDCKNSEDERVKLLSELNQVRDKLRKQEATGEKLSEKLSMRDSENAILRKELDMLKHELKRNNLSSSGNEVKLNKVKEELDRTRAALKQSQLNEKEAKEKCRSVEEDMYFSIKKLERQKTELLSAMKKQIFLIDNLKDQKNNLEAGGLAKITEDEFLKLLEWRPED